MEQVLQQFCLDGTPISCEPLGNGHINRTFRVVCDNRKAYTLQRINRVAFRHPEELIENIDAVSRFIDRKQIGLECIRLCRAKDGRKYCIDDQGEFWRAYNFISGGISLDMPRDRNDFYQAAVAFGKFQQALADFPAASLYETIPHFHDTPARYEQLKQAVQENRAGRLDEIRAELDFYLAREQEAAALMDLCRAGKLPLRVTHNDTKLNNVMLDRFTRAPLCVIDLDTVMPGLAANDFGDSIRFGASGGAEDEKDLSRVTMSLELFETYTEGFLSACGARLTQAEIDTLPMGAKLMTLECGSRFLADYLNGDIYFHVSREGHNLDRARTQMKLVADMEDKWDRMNAIVQEAAQKVR